MEQNGPGLEYRVTWRPQGAPVEREEETVTNHTLRVMTSSVYAPYEVQVQAVNHLGAGPAPQAVVLYSGEDCKCRPRLRPARARGVQLRQVQRTWPGFPRRGQPRGRWSVWAGGGMCGKFYSSLSPQCSCLSMENQYRQLSSTVVPRLPVPFVPKRQRPCDSQCPAPCPGSAVFGPPGARETGPDGGLTSRTHTHTQTQARGPGGRGAGRDVTVTHAP